MIANARSSPAAGAPPTGVRHRFGVAGRALAAIVGGYALAAAFTAAVALAMRASPKEEAIYLATIPSFLLWAGAVVWSFAARTALRAWLGVVLPAVACGAVFLYLKNGGSP